MFDAYCLELTVEGLVAGERATFSLTGETPGETGAVLWGLIDGQLAGHTGIWCVDFGFHIPNTKIAERTLFTDRFDRNGEIVRPVSIPANAKGEDVRFQAAMKNTCPANCMSNIWRGVIE